MSLKSKLYFPNPDLSNEFPLGGVPLFNTDLNQLEVNGRLNGIWALAKDMNVIVSGCLVDELNLNNKTVKITAGTFIIDGIAYYTNGFTTTYPFSLRKGTETADTRTFESGSTYDVAIEYDYSINNSFTDLNALPQDLNLTNEIYFSPFTHQRLEYFLSNFNLGLGELRMGNYLQPFLKTETGKDIIGGACSEFFNGVGRWKYYGYVQENTNYFPQISNNSNSVGGANSVTLSASNLPEHLHSLDLHTQVDGNHYHHFFNAFFSETTGSNSDIRVFEYKNTNLGYQFNNNIIGSKSTDNNNVPYAFQDITNTDTQRTEHQHRIVGKTKGGDSLTAQSFSILPPYKTVNGIKWNGFDSKFNHFIKNLTYTNR